MPSIRLHDNPRSRARIKRWAVLVGLLGLALPHTCNAQTTPRDELLKLVPPDVGLCLVIGDLRGHARKWDGTPWLKALRQSPFVKALVESPEARQIAGIEGELRKHLGVDWPTLRDDILGDAVLFAYRPGPAGKPELEQGMIAVHAARPNLLAELVDRFNRAQKDAGELKSLDALQHQGATYYRRTHVRSTHWYYEHGPLLIVAASEDMLRQAIERDLAKSPPSNPWPERFRRAGAEQSLVTLAVNPRAFELFPAPSKTEKPQGVPAFWRGLDGVFVTLAIDRDIEMRLSLQGRPRDMPAWAQSLLAEKSPSILWQRFPEPAIATLAMRTDFANLAEQFLAVLPEADARKLKDAVTDLGKLTGLDLFRDVLPNIGPDWGVCILPAADGNAFPHVIAALAVKPGSGAEPVDQTLLKGVQLLAGVAVDAFNQANPGDPIRIETVKHGKVSVTVLAHDKLFPAGLRPACAVKDGFLLIASSPDAIARFAAHDASPAAKGEAPLLRVSPAALGQLLRQRRPQVLIDLQKKNALTVQEAERTLDQLLSLLDLFDSVSLSQRSTAEQATWILRVRPRP